MITWMPPIWGRPFEAPSERAAPCANRDDRSGQKSGPSDSAAACRQGRTGTVSHQPPGLSLHKVTGSKLVAVKCLSTERAHEGYEAKGRNPAIDTHR